MKALACIAVIPLLALASCPTGHTPRLVPTSTGAVLAFVDASFVDVGSGTLGRGQTVVVRAGRIQSVSAEAPPPDAKVISATGKFIVPGLIDMHVHMRESDLAAYVDAGITSVRHMWGVPGMLELAARVVQQNELGPTIYAASPGVDGPGSPWPYTELIEDPGAADALIDRLVADGWR